MRPLHSRTRTGDPGCAGCEGEGARELINNIALLMKSSVQVSLPICMHMYVCTTACR